MYAFLKTTLLAAIVFFEVSASAALVSFSGTPGAAIPDDNASGLAYGFNVSTLDPTIVNVTVSFALSGGYNGDLYAYLSHGDGFAVLLNRVGATGIDPTGYADSGFNVTLNATGPDIHNYQTTLGGPPAGGVVTGTWGSDGRISFADSTRDNTLGVFDGTDPNGEWTLFFADRAAGGIATLDSWSVGIEVVPEPADIALIVFGVLFAGVQGVRLLRQRLRLARNRVLKNDSRPPSSWPSPQGEGESFAVSAE